MNKTDVELLFSVGEILECGSGSENAFSIAAILDDRILLRPAMAEAGDINLEYSAIADALASPDGSSIDREESNMRCFVSEYRKRAQARHEDLVDELWDSAAELFLGPVCSVKEPQSMGSIPACPLDASFFLNRR